MKLNYKVSARTILLAVLAVACAAAGAMEWPMPNAAIVRNFGYNDRGKPALGTVFEGTGEILAAETGTLVFSRSGNDFASRLPSPLGTWAAIDHGDGLISIYSRCNEYEKITSLSQVDRGMPIAGAGVSGWSRRDGYYFILFDRKERRWVNSSMIITPFPDTTPPQILGLQLRNADGRILEGGQLQRLSQGRYSIIVNAVDTLAVRGLPIAPYRIVCSVNGMEVGALSFETICARDGVLMITRNSLIPASRVYAPWPAFEAGDVHLSRGQAMLEVIVQDISGNFRNALSRISVE